MKMNAAPRPLSGRTAILAALLSLTACDRLILRQDSAVLSSAIRQESQIDQIRNAIQRVATRHGFQEHPCGDRPNAVLCQSYENAENARFTVVIDGSEPQNLKMSFESFGNLRDPSTAMFDEIVAAVRALP